MKRNLSPYAGIAMLAILLSISSCKKNETNIDPALAPTVQSGPTIPELKLYFSSITGLDTTLIQFDAKREYFIVNGVDQVSKADLSKWLDNSKYTIYNQTKK